MKHENKSVSFYSQGHHEPFKTIERTENNNINQAA